MEDRKLSHLSSEDEKHGHSWNVEFGEASGSGYEKSTRDDGDFNNKKACVKSSKEKCGTIHVGSYNI